VLGELRLVMLTVAKSNVPVAGRAAELLGAMTSQPPASSGLWATPASSATGASRTPSTSFPFDEQDAIEDRQRIRHGKLSQVVPSCQPPVSSILPCLASAPSRIDEPVIILTGFRDFL